MNDPQNNAVHAAINAIAEARIALISAEHLIDIGQTNSARICIETAFKELANSEQRLRATLRP